jgi:hypothetical protein
VPFLRLTRDRRGFENTFLMHADRPGDRPRLLYWYRTAPGIVLGRPALDEDAIRTIEEQHPDIDFDWPAILALSEVMTPEEEDAPRPEKKRKSAPPREKSREERREERSASIGQPASEERSAYAAPSASAHPTSDRLRPDDRVENDAVTASSDAVGEAGDDEAPITHRGSGLLEELVGREIATRLRARYAEIQARIHEQQVDVARRDQWLKRAEAINPDLWVTPDAILDGVRSADATFTQLQNEIVSA